MPSIAISRISSASVIGGGLVTKAMVLAMRAHDGQYRRWNNDPFIVHPARVADIINEFPAAEEYSIAIAWLHDVLQKCPKSYCDELIATFPEHVVLTVQELTPLPPSAVLSKHDRKNRNKERLKKISDHAKFIKLADKIDKLQEISATVPTEYIIKLISETEEALPVLSNVGTHLSAEVKILSQSLESEITRLKHMVY